MATIYTDNVLPETSGVSETLNFGTAGDTVTLPAGVTLKTNKIVDAGGNNIITSDGSGNLTVAGSMSGSIALLNTATADNQASISFTTAISGFNTTYKTYLIRLESVRPHSPSGGNTLLFNGSTDAGSTYATSHMNTFIREERADNGSASPPYGGTCAYNTTFEHDMGTGDSEISTADNDNATDVWVGEIYLFNPSSTSFNCHFQFVISGVYVGGGISSTYMEWGNGYFDTIADIDGIIIKMNSGNLTGVAKLYGIG